MSEENGKTVEEGEGALGTGNDARVALLNRINDANDGLHAEDYANVNDDDTTEPFVVEAQDGTREPLVDETVEDPIATEELARMEAEIANEPPAPRKMKLKVNGREMELTEAEVIARAQQVEAAEQYLSEAKRIRGELKAEQEARQAQPAAEVVVEDDLALARAIQMGSEEEAAAVIRKIRAERPAQPTITQEQIAQTIDERLTFKGALQWFDEAYPEIVGDPVLHQMAKDTDAKLIAAGDRRSYQERYKEVGDAIMGKLEQWTAKRTPTAPPQGQDKLRRKAAAPQPAKPAGAKSEAAAGDEPDETPAQIIANMAKSRGGPQWMRS